jgi:hypothetical protein
MCHVDRALLIEEEWCRHTYKYMQYLSLCQSVAGGNANNEYAMRLMCNNRVERFTYRRLNSVDGNLHRFSRTALSFPPLKNARIIYI